MQFWKTTSPDYSFKTSLDAGASQLPRFFARMLANKTWRTMNEEALSVSSAAWAWIREYLEKDYKGQGVVLKDPSLEFCLLLTKEFDVMSGFVCCIFACCLSVCCICYVHVDWTDSFFID